MAEPNCHHCFKLSLLILQAPHTLTFHKAGVVNLEERCGLPLGSTSLCYLHFRHQNHRKPQCMATSRAEKRNFLHYDNKMKYLKHLNRRSLPQKREVDV